MFSDLFLSLFLFMSYCLLIFVIQLVDGDGHPGPEKLAELRIAAEAARAWGHPTLDSPVLNGCLQRMPTRVHWADDNQEVVARELPRDSRHGFVRHAVSTRPTTSGSLLPPPCCALTQRPMDRALFRRSSRTPGRLGRTRRTA